MKVVVDTNVIIAAFLTSGTSQKVLDLLLSRKVCFVSKYILDEFQTVLSSKKFGFPKPVIEGYLRYLKKYCHIEKESKGSKLPKVDPKDLKVLALCQIIEAHFLITGDKELLGLRRIQSTFIVSPTDFLKSLARDF